MSESGGRVCVRLRVGGLEFEVVCGVGEVDVVVGRLLSAVKERLGGEAFGGLVGGGAGGVGVGHGGVRADTCKGIIERLWNEGWFSVGRSLGEVHGEMGRRGFHYDRTAVAHGLVDLVKEGVLTRLGRPRRYSYVQKKPPPVPVAEKVVEEKPEKEEAEEKEEE